MRVGGRMRPVPEDECECEERAEGQRRKHQYAGQADRAQNHVADGDFGCGLRRNNLDNERVGYLHGT